jgi:hypothetical protein
MVCIKKERLMINIIKLKFIIFCLSLCLGFISFAALSQESLTTVIIDDVDDSKKNDDSVKALDLDKKSPTDVVNKGTDKNDEKEKQQDNKNLGSNEKVAGIEDILLQQKPSVSLMFSDADQKNINRAMMAYKAKEAFVVNQTDAKAKEKSGKKKTVVENEKSFLHLSSIIYFSSDAWSLWIDSNKITSDSNKVGSDLYIKSISPEKITIVWTMSVSKWKILSGKTSESDIPKVNKDEQVEIEFTLRQNQTYMLTTNKVIEGKISVISDKAKDNSGLDAAPKNP